MVDISSLLANSAETKADFNFGKITDAYWAGLENAYKQRTREAFSDPSTYSSDGKLDPDKLVIQGLKSGVSPEGVARLFETGALQQQYGNAAKMNRKLYGGGSDGTDPNAFPPSISGTSTAPERVQPDLTQGRGTQPPQGGPQQSQAPQPTAGPSGVPTIMTKTADNADIPNHQMVRASKYIAQQLTAAGIPVGPAGEVDWSNPKAQEIFDKSVQTLTGAGIGQAYRPGEATPRTQVLPQGPQIAQGGPQPPVQPPVPQPAPVQPPPQQPPVAPPQPPVAPVQPQQPPQDTSAQARGPDPLNDQTLGGLIDPSLLRAGGGTAAGALAFLEAHLRQGLPPASRPQVEAQAAAIRAKLGEGTNPKYQMYVKQQVATGNRILPQEQWELQQEGAKERQKLQITSGEKERDDLIQTGKSASNRLFTLNTILNVATNDKNVGFGFGADTELKIKKAIQRIAPDAIGDISGSELIEKMNSVLASEMAKTVTNRPTQFEFKTFLANNPGLLTTREGTVRLASIYQQLAQRDVDLGKLARSQDTFDDWPAVVERYDARHPVTDPVLKKPIYTESIVAPGPEGGARVPKIPPNAPPGARPAPDGRGFMVPNPDPNADKTKNPYVRWIPS